MDGWRIMEYDRLWTDIKGYWRQGHVEKLCCVKEIFERMSENIMEFGRRYQESVGSFGYPLC
jgi:hypothetical protein